MACGGSYDADRRQHTTNLTKAAMEQEGRARAGYTKLLLKLSPPIKDLSTVSHGRHGAPR